MKARIAHAAKETNPGKLQKLDELQAVYRAYVQICIDQMIKDKRTKVFLHELRTYFPTSEILSSQILKNAQKHAASTVETWLKSLYGRQFKKDINRSNVFTEQQKIELYCIGKYLILVPGPFGKGTISQEMIDLYWSWVWNPKIAGNPPQVSERFPMWMTEMTCSYGPSEETGKFSWWIGV